MENSYKVEVKSASRTLTAKERIMVKQLSSAQRLDELTQDGPVYIHADAYAILSVHNEKSKGDKDYETMVLLDTDGSLYVTGSASFRNAIEDLWDDYKELADSGEEISFKVFRLPSKNYKGKEFISATII